MGRENLKMVISGVHCYYTVKDSKDQKAIESYDNYAITGEL